jgi:glutathione-regulated potassium-efflux system ancillary protein KefG
MSDSSSCRVLVLFAHPRPHLSRVNQELVRAARAVEGVTVHDLYEAYPDADILVGVEQKLLLDHDVVVMQHPFYWYSVPPLLKEWMDLVLEHGWAYGSRGTRLRGKWLMSAITTGGRAGSYGPGNLNRYTVREFLRPIEQTTRLCNMVYLPPFLAQGTHRIDKSDILGHAGDYQRVLEALRDGRVDAERIADLERINGDLAAVIGAPGHGPTRQEAAP